MARIFHRSIAVSQPTTGQYRETYQAGIPESGIHDTSLLDPFLRFSDTPAGGCTCSEIAKVRLTSLEPQRGPA